LLYRFEYIVHSVGTPKQNK